MSEMRTKIMRDASYLLPPPGGEVVRDLLDSYDTLLARHNALREAVAKMLTAYKNAEECSCPYCLEGFENARAEVDRLIANESAADCEGEG